MSNNAYLDIIGFKGGAILVYVEKKNLYTAIHFDVGSGVYDMAIGKFSLF